MTEPLAEEPVAEISQEALLACWREYVTAGRRGEYHDFLARHYWPLAKRIAGKIAQKLPRSVDRDDLESWSTLGLIRGMATYNPYPTIVVNAAGKEVVKPPVKFETFAVACMYSSVLDALRKQDWAPRSLRKRQRDIEQARAGLQHELNRRPTDEEVAERTGITEETLRRTQQEIASSWHTYLEEVTEREEPAHPAPAEELDITVQLRLVLVEEMDQMSELHQAVLALHYYEELPMKDVAARMGITEAQAQQLNQAAIGRIWRSMVGSLGVELLPYIGT